MKPFTAPFHRVGYSIQDSTGLLVLPSPWAHDPPLPPEDVVRARCEQIEWIAAAMTEHAGCIALRPWGVQLIEEERRRQVSGEGWTAQDDDFHDLGEMCSAAVVYATAGDCLANAPVMMGANWKGTPETLKEEFESGDLGKQFAWPFDFKWLKISPDPVRNLVKAGALIAAEIDRLTRRRIMGAPAGPKG